MILSCKKFEYEIYILCNFNFVYFLQHPLTMEVNEKYVYW